MELPIWEMKLMPRRPLLKLPGVPLHIIQRGNKRAACFFATKDYGCYLHHLQHLCQAEGVVLHAYVLMTNHVHLLLTPQQSKNVVCPRFPPSGRPHTSQPCGANLSCALPLPLYASARPRAFPVVSHALQGLHPTP